jgi:DNA-binding response OmpR family regulator
MTSLGNEVRHYADPEVARGIEPQRVLLVDVAGGTRLALSEAMTEAGLAVQSAGGDVDALDKARSWRPDLVLISLEMIAESGLMTCRRIMQETGAPTMLLSSEEVDAIDRRAGANGADRVAERVARMLRARTPAEAALPLRPPNQDPGEIMEVGPVTLNPARRSVLVRGEKVPIRRLEYDLLLALVRQAGSICTRENLASALWPRGLPASDPIDVHIRRLRSKIELDPKRPRHIVTVRKFGYYFDPDGEPDARGSR